MHRRFVITALAALVAAPALMPATADAQRTRRGTSTRVVQTSRSYGDYDWMAARQLSLSVGALTYDPAGDENHPMAALRVDWRLRRWLRSEVSLSYAMAEFDRPVTIGDDDDEMNSSLLAGTVGLQAEAPFRYVRPYVGAAAGLFGRFDEEGGDQFVRPTMAFPVGVRIPVSPRLGLRVEARLRFDEHQGGGSSANLEQTVGLSFGF